MTAFKQFCASLALVLPLAAQAPPAGPPALPPAPPTQGFESNIQLPATYTQQEAAAVNVVENWVRTTAAHDLDGVMSMLDNNILVRPDPARQPAYGPVAQCSSYPFPRDNSIVRLEEVYVVGGPLDTMVMFKRADINGPAVPPGGRGAIFGGFTVQVAVMVRVSNGRITEWLDAPINRIGGLVGSTEGALMQAPAGANIPEPCKKYPIAGATPAAQARPVGPLPYGTAKHERYWNVEEQQAAQAVRAWFAAKQAGDPLLLGAFVDQNVVFRTSPAEKFGKGRENLLRTVCPTIGGQQRLTKLFPIGSDFDTMVLAESINNQGTRVASIFRVQKSLITEWMEVVVDAQGLALAANPNSAACRAVNSAVAR